MQGVLLMVIRVKVQDGEGWRLVGSQRNGVEKVLGPFIREGVGSIRRVTKRDLQ